MQSGVPAVLACLPPSAVPSAVPAGAALAVWPPVPSAALGLKGLPDGPLPSATLPGAWPPPPSPDAVERPASTPALALLRRPRALLDLGRLLILTIFLPPILPSR